MCNCLTVIIDAKPPVNTIPGKLVALLATEIFELFGKFPAWGSNTAAYVPVLVSIFNRLEPSLPDLLLGLSTPQPPSPPQPLPPVRRETGDDGVRAQVPYGGQQPVPLPHQGVGVVQFGYHPPPMDADTRRDGRDISAALNMRLREALAHFLNNFPADTIAYFEPRMETSQHYRTLFKELLDEHVDSTRELQQYRTQPVARALAHREVTGLFEDQQEQERAASARAQLEAAKAEIEAAMRETIVAEMREKEAELRVELERNLLQQLEAVTADKERELQVALERLQLQGASGSHNLSSEMWKSPNERKRKSLPSNSLEFTPEAVAAVTRIHKRNHSTTSFLDQR
jgi:hypothetical protein